MAVAHESIFTEAAKALCGMHPHPECVVATFGQLPPAAVMLLLAPFLWSSPKQKTPKGVRFLPMNHSIMAGWPWAGFWILLSIAISASYASHLVVRQELGPGQGNSAEIVSIGAWLWPIAGGLVMALNAAIVWRRAQEGLGLPDYLLWWWLCSFALVVASSVVGVDAVVRGEAASVEQDLAIARAALFGPLALVALVNFGSRFSVRDTVACCGLLLGRIDLPAPAPAPSHGPANRTRLLDTAGDLPAGLARGSSGGSAYGASSLPQGSAGASAGAGGSAIVASCGLLEKEYASDYCGPEADVFGPAALSGKHALGGSTTSGKKDADKDGDSETLTKEERQAAVALEEAEARDRARRAAAAWSGLTPEEVAGLCSRLTFFWMQNTLVTGWGRPLDSADVPPLAHGDRARFVGESFAREWDAEVETARKAKAEAVSMGRDVTGVEWDTTAQYTAASASSGKKADGDAPKSCLVSLVARIASCVGGLGSCVVGCSACVRFLACGRRRGTPYKPSLPFALTRAFGPMLYQAVVLKLLYDVIKFSGPALLNAVITYLTDIAAGAEGASEGVGYGYVALLAASSVLQTVILHQYFLRMFRLGMHLRTAVIGSVFRKALRLSVAARQQRTVGQIINVASTDASRMRDLATYLVMLESGPVQIVLSVVFLWQQIGPSVLVGVAAMVLFIPINLTIARLQKQLQGKLMKIKDKRIDSTLEAISAAKLIKLHAWEDEIVGRITDTRNDETTQLWWYMLVRNGSTVLWVGLPLIVSVLSFATFVWTGGQLTAAKAFTALSLFSILQFPLSMFPSVINNCIEALVSIQRIESFLGSGEVESDSCIRVDPLGIGSGTGDADPALTTRDSKAVAGSAGSEVAETGLPAIELDRATFSWAPPEALPASPGAAGGAVSGRYHALGAGASGDVEKGEASSVLSEREAMSRPVMSDVTFQVARGELVVVAGRVGSGKTSLLHGILGELHKLSGTAIIRGSVAFVSQTPFILNDTLKNNILFGRKLDQDRYERVLKVCHLAADLKELPGGDQCEIGERGINLSGGTRARVSLARGVYADSDVYLLDDPLSAVDAHVGAGIFSDCITGVLAGKTRLLVTHGVSFMRSCSRVFVVKDGSIVQQGPLAELLRDGSAGSEIRVIVSSYEHDASSMATATDAAAGSAAAKESEAAADEEGEDADAPGGSTKAREPEGAAAGAATVGGKTEQSRSLTGRLTKRESVGRGSVRLGVFGEYAKALGGWPVVLTMAVLFALAQGSQVLVNWWLSHWSTGVQGIPDADITELNQQYLAGYAALSVLSLLVIVALRLAVAVFGVRAARRLHETLINAVPWARMSFFDTTPAGRILNRFAGDMYTVDEMLMPTVASLASTLCTVIGTVVVIASATPLFLLLLLPLLFIYLYTQRYYVSTSRELQRLDSASRSPIVAQFGEALGGAVTIRAYADEPRFRRLSDALVDTNQSAYFAGVSANRWLAVRLEFVGALVTTGAALFAVVARDSIDPSVAGLSISYALNITQTLNWTVRMMSNVETQIVSVERIREYSDVTTEPRSLRPESASTRREPQEPQSFLAQAEADAVAEASDSRLRGWPSKGAIRIRGLRLHYRSDTPAVLHGVDMDIPAASKVGIVGRTGAGKSSLVSALFRLAEVQTGLVSIDGVDISTVPLRILRSRIAIIPQEATLLTGTVKTNMDPFNTFSSMQLIAALRQVGVMRHLVKRLAKKDSGKESADDQASDGDEADEDEDDKPTDAEAVLDLPVSEGGGNFSAGTRQLLCVARAVLKQCKVVVLDEASSSMDAATDAALQRAIRTEFADATVLTIAHRLHTILDSSLVVVMGSGRVLESDSPSTLLADADSEFSQLVRWSRGRTPPADASAGGSA